jgi:hypothetical protein
MDHDDLNETLDEGLGDDGDGRPAPTWRATIRGRRLMLTNWAPWLVHGGPQTKLLTEREQAGFTIADLTVHGQDDDEVSVRFYAVGTEVERAEELLIEWATRVGYRRLWLPDRLVAIEPQPDKLGTASVRCPTCRAVWQDSSPEFWLTVKRGSVFPKWCPVCGCELPQWDVRDARHRRRARRRAGGESWSASESRSEPRPNRR